MFKKELPFKIWKTEEALTKCAVPENMIHSPYRRVEVSKETVVLRRWG